MTGVSTEEYFASKPDAAPRPLNSTLDLRKIKAAGFFPRPMPDALKTHLGTRP